MTDISKKLNFTEALSKLEEINNWFQNEDVDLDEGLKKIKEGNELIKTCRGRLKDVENEFVKLKQENEAEQLNASNNRSENSSSNKHANKNSDIPF